MSDSEHGLYSFCFWGCGFGRRFIGVRINEPHLPVLIYDTMKFTDRKAKAEKWVAECDGTAYSGDIIKAYRKKFAVDYMKAVAELQLLGVSLTQEQIDREKAAVKACQDDTFYYIAGYTSGGAPYGVTWEEMGLKSDIWSFTNVSMKYRGNMSSL